MPSLTSSTEPIKWFIECGAHLPNGKFIRNHLIETNEVNLFRFKYDNTGVFTTAYIYDSKDQNTANLHGDFYLDFDYDLDGNEQETAFNIVRQDVISACRYLKVILGVEQESIMLFFSGKKGIHLIVPKEVMDVPPSKYLNKYYKMLAEDINMYTSGKTIDLKIYDNKRLLRMPNSIHQSTNLYKVYLSFEELSTMSYLDIKNMATKPRVIPQAKNKISIRAKMEMQGYEKKFDLLLNKTKTTFTSDNTLSYTPPCVNYLLTNPVGAGQRNDTVAFLANFFKQSGLNEEEAKAKLYSWNEEYCTPSLPDREIDITTNSIYSGNAKMGCSTARIISQCDIEQCKLNRKRR